MFWKKEKAMGRILNIFLLSALLVTAVLATETSVAPQSPHPRPFVDLDGDGFNDLAPDHDNDGIPNCVDPDFIPGSDKNRRRGRGSRNLRWSLYQSMPDSVSQDSLGFQQWWESQGNRASWVRAWEQWQHSQNNQGRGFGPGWDSGGANPQGGRFRNDPRRPETDREGNGGNGSGNGGPGNSGGTGGSRPTP